MNRPDGNINTVANAITITGGSLVAKGLREGIDTPTGLALVAAGRAADLIDGPTARARHEDSDLGAILDASFDKVGCAAIAFSMYRKDIVPTPVFIGMATQNLANGVATAKAQKAHPESKLLPSKKGKLAMFSQNVALLSYNYSHISDKKAQELAADNPEQIEAIQKHKRRAKISRTVGHVASGIGVIGLGVPATLGYVKRAKK
jgi:phosphatidylglycerophosphate synthase